MRIEIRRVVEDKSTRFAKADKRIYWQVVLVGAKMERVQDHLVTTERIAEVEADYWHRLLGWPITRVEVEK